MSIKKYKDQYVFEGIRIAPKGENFKLITPEKDLLNSKYPLLKGYMSGILTYTFSSNPGVGTLNMVSLNHPLGYKLVGLVYSDRSGRFRQLAPTDIIIYSYDFHFPSMEYWENYQAIGYYVSATKLQIYYIHTHVDTPDAGGEVNMNGVSINFRYVLFPDKLT